MGMDVLIFWIIFVVLIGVWANSLGRNPWVWGLLAALITPLITAIILLFAGKTIEKKAEEAKKIRELSE